MIFAKIHTYNGGQQTVCARSDQPDASWIPFDVPNNDWLVLVNGVITIQQPVVPVAEQFKAIERRFEKHMDEVAQADGWDNRWTCVARAGYFNPWQAKGIKFAQWMDACWMVAIQAQNDVVAGKRTIPTPDEAVLELPVMVW